MWRLSLVWGIQQQSTDWHADILIYTWWPSIRTWFGPLLYKACGKWSKLCRQGKYIYKGTNWDSPSNKQPSWAVLTCHTFFVLCWWLHSLCLNCVIIKMGNYLLLSTSKTLKEIKQDKWESTANFEEPHINGTGYYYFTHRKGIV